jgi:hypothetical protein
MASTDVIIKSLISSRSPEIPPDSPAYMFEDSSHAHVPPQVGGIDRFEYAVKKLIRALEKLNARNKTKDIKIEVTKHVEAKKSKIRASKLKYKLIDEVYVG